MADVKWIKICTDIFNDEKILLIESLPEADSIIVIWFKLLCLAGKQNNSGVFMLNDKLAYTDEMLATIFRKPINTVRLALNTFESFGMIEMIDNVITIPNWEKHQSLDKLEMAREQTRKRVAKHREKQKTKALGTIQNICAYCGNKATTIDHIISKSKGGTDDPENVVECCTECNSSKQDRELIDFLNNCVHICYVGADIERILNNPKLNRYVDYDGEKFVKCCNTLRNVTVQKCNANRLEEDKDIDKDKEIDNIFNIPELDQVFNEWLQYKKQKGQTYKEKGLTALINKIKKQLEITSAESIIQDIENCMANNYQGIFFKQTKEVNTNPFS